MRTNKSKRIKKAKEYLKRKMKAEEEENIEFLVGMLTGVFTGMAAAIILYRIYNF